MYIATAADLTRPPRYSTYASGRPSHHARPAERQGCHLPAGSGTCRRGRYGAEQMAKRNEEDRSRETSLIDTWHAAVGRTIFAGEIVRLRDCRLVCCPARLRPRRPHRCGSNDQLNGGRDVALGGGRSCSRRCYRCRDLRLAAPLLRRILHRGDRLRRVFLGVLHQPPPANRLVAGG